LHIFHRVFPCRYIAETEPARGKVEESRRMNPSARTFDEWARTVAAPIWRAI